jgi:UV DNA damage repair endonuclease
VNVGRFFKRQLIERFFTLHSAIRRRFVIGNDDRSYILVDCILIHDETRITVIFDFLNQTIYSWWEQVGEALHLVLETRKSKGGIPGVDYRYGQTKNKSPEACVNN